MIKKINFFVDLNDKISYISHPIWNELFENFEGVAQLGRAIRLWRMGSGFESKINCDLRV